MEPRALKAIKLNGGPQDITMSLRKKTTRSDIKKVKTQDSSHPFVISVLGVNPKLVNYSSKKNLIPFKS